MVMQNIADWRCEVAQNEVMQYIKHKNRDLKLIGDTSNTSLNSEQRGGRCDTVDDIDWTAILHPISM